MRSPFISIVMPTYRRPEFLRKLLDSIKEQTFRDFEVCITDDTRDDSIKNLVEAYKACFTLHYKKNETQLMAVGNYNEALNAANGEWIKQMHDDDWFSSPGSLQKFADAARQNPNAGFIFSSYIDYDIDTNKQVTKKLEGWRLETMEAAPLGLFFENVIGPPSTTLVRNNKTIAYDEKTLFCTDDIDFYMRYINQYKGYVYIPDSLICIGKGAFQGTSNVYKNSKVELPAYFYLLSKLGFDAMKNFFVFHRFWIFVRRYQIKDETIIRESGYTGFIPEAIQHIIYCQQRIPRIILKQTPFSKRLAKMCFRQFLKRSKLL